jgi:hypothetical protein
VKRQQEISKKELQEQLKYSQQKNQADQESHRLSNIYLLNSNVSKIHFQAIARF